MPEDSSQNTGNVSSISLSSFGGATANGLRYLLSCEGWVAHPKPEYSAYGFKNFGEGGYSGYGWNKSKKDYIGIGPGMVNSGGVGKKAREMGKNITLGDKDFMSEGIMFEANEIVALWAKFVSDMYKTYINKYTDNNPNKWGSAMNDCILYTTWHLPLAGRKLCEKLNSSDSSAWSTYESAYNFFNFKVDGWGTLGFGGDGGGSKELKDYSAMVSGQTKGTESDSYKAWQGNDSTIEGFLQKVLGGEYTGGGGAGAPPSGATNGTVVGGGTYIRGQNYGGRTIKSGNPNTVYNLSSGGSEKEHVLKLNGVRRQQFQEKRDEMINQIPNREREIIITDELYNPSILKTSQRSKQERKQTVRK